MLVDTEKIKVCKQWAETIHQNIMDSFAYYGYLQGLDAFFKSYEHKNKLSIACVEFIKHQKYLLQTAICLNIAKLLFDKGKDVYSFENYRKTIDNYRGEYLRVKPISIGKNLEDAVKNFRTNYIAHSIENSDFVSVKMSDLYEVLKLEVTYFNVITDDVIFEQCYRFNDDAIEKWIHHCTTGVWDFILMMKDKI
ncbi:MAG: hypothetical protein J6K52_07645 [Clostridia bacterium]|nr:hypothetical protein [Clostridia bacterium]